LRYYATSWNVAGSIPDGVNGIFHSQYLLPHHGLVVVSAANRKDYQNHFVGGKARWCIGLTVLPHSPADCLDILEPQPSGTLRACPGIAKLYFLTVVVMMILVVWRVYCLFS
jgi:hypothetical protein